MTDTVVVFFVFFHELLLLIQKLYFCRMGDNIRLNIVGHVTAATEVAPDNNAAGDDYETMTPPATPDEDLYEAVSPRTTPEPAEDPQGYLLPNPDHQQGGQTSTNNQNGRNTGLKFFCLWSGGFELRCLIFLLMC